MVDFNTMSDEQVLRQSDGSILNAFLSNFFLSLITLGIYPVLAARNSGVAVTDQRIIIKNGGLFGASTNEVRLDNIQGVQTESLKLLKILPLGNAVTVSNAAGETFIINSGNPGDVRNAINRAQS
ncbi:MAG: PH domain-containing protein [Halobacteriaceae archaeon]